MTAVTGDRRYKSSNRCPICNGCDQDERGSEKRCFGFLSEDETHAHCSREEFAGPIPVSSGQTYGHRLAGPCRCGKQHSEGAAALERPKRKIVKEYDYRDEVGDLLYQVVRYEPKAFGQRRPPVEPGGAWIWKLEGVRRVLYHLDRLMEADPEAIVWIPEGEKDVEALEMLGLVATCNPQGAEKWSHVAECASLHLVGRRCVIIRDPDDPGRRHGADVEARLTGVASSVRVIELPDGQDAAEWIAAGGTSEQLLELAERPAPKVAPSVNVKGDFHRDDKGKIFHTQQNIRLALAKLGVVLRHDEFAHRDHVTGLPEAGPYLDALARNRLRLVVDEKYGFRLSKEWWQDVLRNEAWSNRFHPVREYLAGLKWDGRPRIGHEDGRPGWLTTYGGAPDNPYVRAVSRLILVAAVRRVREPGCKFDEMVILESPMGKNKSQALAALAVRPEWFCDDLPVASETRDLMEATNGAWIACAEEMAGAGKAGISKLKSYISRTHDQARLAYREDAERVLRQFVLFGTSNRLDGYLRDPTGNRKFWPVRIKEFDLARLRADVAQIWAEAAAAESTGETVRLDPRLYGVAGEEQEARYATDAMEVLCTEAFGDLVGKVPTTEAWKILGLINRTMTQDEQTRFNNAMRRLGWIQTKRRDPIEKANKPRYCYVKEPDGDEESMWLQVEGEGRTAYVRPR